MRISLTATDLWRVQEWKQINGRAISWKLRKGDLSFLCVTRCPDLIHIPIKLQEDIPDGYRVMACTRMETN